MEVYELNNKNKIVVTKENLINIILDKCEDDFISTKDLLELIDKASEDGVMSKKKLIKSVKSLHTKSV